MNIFIMINLNELVLVYIETWSFIIYTIIVCSRL